MSAHVSHTWIHTCVMYSYNSQDTQNHQQFMNFIKKKYKFVNKSEQPCIQTHFNIIIYSQPSKTCIILWVKKYENNFIFESLINCETAKTALLLKNIATLNVISQFLVHSSRYIYIASHRKQFHICVQCST